MPRGLDHIVHAVRDLDAAADFYRRLGFAVGARNRHSWGTHNHLVQLPGFFVELLTVAEPEKLGSDGFSTLFGRFNQSYLKSHQGFSLLILESDDATADAAAFASAGIAASEAIRFERKGKKPDGAEVTVAFSLAFARDKTAPEAAFATCQQHFPENFWNPQFQQHANSAIGVAGVALVAENPSDHHIFLSAFTGIRELHATSSGIVAPTPRGEVAIMDPSAFRNHFAAAPPDVSSGARIATLRIAVADLEAATVALSAGKVEFTTHLGRAIVAPENAMGATIVFEPTAPR